MKRRDILTIYFLGALAFGAWYSLFQDILGLEGYIDWVRTYWASPYITAPIALTSLIVSWVFLGKFLNKVREKGTLTVEVTLKRVVEETSNPDRKKETPQ